MTPMAHYLSMDVPKSYLPYSLTGCLRSQRMVRCRRPDSQPIQLADGGAIVVDEIDPGVHKDHFWHFCQMICMMYADNLLNFGLLLPEGVTHRMQGR